MIGLWDIPTLLRCAIFSGRESEKGHRDASSAVHDSNAPKADAPPPRERRPSMSDMGRGLREQPGA
jgi:hypothetical protein